MEVADNDGEGLGEGVRVADADVLEVGVGVSDGLKDCVRVGLEVGLPVSVAMKDAEKKLVLHPRDNPIATIDLTLSLNVAKGSWGRFRRAD